MIGATTEFKVGGILFAPIIFDAALAALIFLALRPLLRLARFERRFANPPLVQLAIYTIILGLVIVVA